MHEYLLAGWGVPIGRWPLEKYLIMTLIRTTFLGKLFDLEQLAQTCKEMKRWSFFLTSMPLN